MLAWNLGACDASRMVAMHQGMTLEYGEDTAGKVTGEGFAAQPGRKIANVKSSSFAEARRDSDKIICGRARQRGLHSGPLPIDFRLYAAEVLGTAADSGRFRR